MFRITIFWTHLFTVGFRTIRYSNAGRDKRFFSSPKRSNRLWSRPGLLFSGYRGSFPGVNQLRREVNQFFHLVLSLRISGAIPLFRLCAFMTWRGTTLPFALYFGILTSADEITTVLCTCKKGKIKFALEQAMKAQMGSRDIALLFL